MGNERRIHTIFVHTTFVVSYVLCVCLAECFGQEKCSYIFTVKGINLFYIFQDPCNDQKYFCTILFRPKEFKMRNHERKSEIIWICYTAFKK